MEDGSLDKLPSKDEDFELVGTDGLCRGKDWAIEGRKTGCIFADVAENYTCFKSFQAQTFDFCTIQ